LLAVIVLKTPAVLGMMNLIRQPNAVGYLKSQLLASARGAISNSS
jgi:hypothetical protein